MSHESARHRRPRLLVFNRYYWPGVEATAQLLAQLCEALACDYDVTVVTGNLHGHDVPAEETRNGVRIDQSDIYVTASPCWNCFKMLANAGVVRIAYGEFYRDERIFDFAKRLGIELVACTLEATE